MLELTDLNTFLKMFSGNNITEKQFFNKAQVRVGDKLHPLDEYIKIKKIHKNDIKTLFHLIQNRDDYLIRFYNMSLRVQPSNYVIHNQVSPMKSKAMNNNEYPLFKNFIRNLHMLDILQNTKSGIENIPTYMDVLKDLYLKNIIDYKILTPSSLHYMNEGRLGSVFSSYYFRASIMNPYLVYSLNHSLLKGTKIFTPTLGWTSYCYGFLECPSVV